MSSWRAPRRPASTFYIHISVVLC